MAYLGDFDQPIVSANFAALIAGIGQWITQNNGSLLEKTIIVPKDNLGAIILNESAQHHGIIGGVRYRLPAQFLWDLTHQLNPHLASESPIESMEWQIWQWLQTTPLDALPPRLAAWIGKNQRPANEQALKEWQFAQQIARSLDRYRLESPDGLALWQQSVAVNDEDAWQKALWLAILERVGLITDREQKQSANPLLEWVSAFERQGKNHPLAPWLGTIYPEGLQVFLHDPLPALHERAFRALSQIIPITVWHHCPAMFEIPSLRYACARLYGEDYQQRAQNDHRFLTTPPTKETPEGVLQAIQQAVFHQQPHLVQDDPQNNFRIETFSSLHEESQASIDHLLRHIDWQSPLIPDIQIYCTDPFRYHAHWQSILATIPDCPLALSHAPTLSPSTQQLIQSTLEFIREAQMDSALLSAIWFHPLASRFSQWDEGTMTILQNWLNESGWHRLIRQGENINSETEIAIERLALGWFASSARLSGKSASVRANHLTTMQLGVALDQLLTHIVTAREWVAWALIDHPLGELVNRWQQWMHALSPEIDRWVQSMAALLYREHRAGWGVTVPRSLAVELLQNAGQQLAQHFLPLSNPSATRKITLRLSSLYDFVSLPCDHLLILGLNQQGYPAEIDKPAFDLMHKNVKHPHLPPERSADHRQTMVARILDSPRQSLWLSYTQQNTSGSSAFPSFAINLLKKIIAEALPDFFAAEKTTVATCPTRKLIPPSQRYALMWSIKPTPIAPQQIYWDQVVRDLQNPLRHFIWQGIGAEFFKTQDECENAPLDRTQMRIWAKSLPVMHDLIGRAMALLPLSSDRHMAELAKEVRTQAVRDWQASGYWQDGWISAPLIAEEMDPWLKKWLQLYTHIHHHAQASPSSTLPSLTLASGQCINTLAQTNRVHALFWQGDSSAGASHWALLSFDRLPQGAEAKWLVYLWWLWWQQFGSTHLFCFDKHEGKTQQYAGADHFAPIDVRQSLAHLLQWWQSNGSAPSPIFPQWLSAIHEDPSSAVFTPYRWQKIHSAGYSPSQERLRNEPWSEWLWQAGREYCLAQFNDPQFLPLRQQQQTQWQQCLQVNDCGVTFRGSD